MIYKEFAQTASLNAEKEALVIDGKSLTYSELLKSVNATALALQEQGVKAGDVVLLIVPNGMGFVVSVFATLALGAVIVPINTKFPLDEVEYYLESSGAQYIVHDADAARYLEAGFACNLLDINQLLEAETSDEFVASDIDPESSALFMYSSGSTGKPKRVTRTHGHIISEHASLSSSISLTSADRILCTVPMYHAHGLGNCMMASLLTGGCLVVVSGEFNPRETMRAMTQQQVSIYPAVPFMCKMISDSFYKEKPDLSKLRLIFSAGAPLPAEVESRFFEKLGVHIRQLYGSTETGAVAINFSDTEGGIDSVGKALNDVEITIVDEEGAILPAGEIGEVAIKSPAMTKQYDHLPDVTAESFINGSFYPGDLGCLDQHGNLYIKGRKKLMINVAGYKVDPLDVEDVIRTHADVEDVVVVGKPHELYGEMVKAVVVKTNNAEMDEESVIKLCKQSLAEYKVPKQVEFRDEIPRSPLGKILRKYL